jgi:hypothetical protein
MGCFLALSAQAVPAASDDGFAPGAMDRLKISVK